MSAAVIADRLQGPPPSVKQGNNGHVWLIISVMIASIVLMPLVVILWSITDWQSDVWRHLIDTQLAQLVTNTLILTLGVAFGVSILGTLLAWLTTQCEFPGRSFWQWALVLPLALPAYILAFVTVGLWDYTGPLQTGLRSAFSNQLVLPSIRSHGGIIIVFVLVLYPYVYLLARSAFLSQGRMLTDAARSLGASPTQAFFKVSLPMARPAIAAGMALALMETLADFGAVSVFNYDTFTLAIYKSWYGFFNLSAAAQLASCLLLFAAMALITERTARGRSKYFSTQPKNRIKPQFQLNGAKAYAAVGICTLVLLLSFIIPVGQLIIWMINDQSLQLDSRYLSFLGHTLSLAGVAALLTVALALLLAYVNHSMKKSHPWIVHVSQVATLGYALPGAVLAIGLVLVFGLLDRTVVTLIRGWFDLPPQQVLLGSLAVLFMAYAVRFLQVGFGAVDANFQRIKPSFQEAARTLGADRLTVLTRIYLPMLGPGLLTAILLVFVDVMKEMPATLILRPFGWDTLAVRIYELTSEGEWELAALPALTLVVVGLLPVILLTRKMIK